MKFNLAKIYIVLVLLAGVLPCQAKHMAVVVNKGNATDNVSSGDLSKIFQTNTKKWPDGKNITLVVRDSSSADTQEALQRLYKMTQLEVKSFVDQHRAAFVFCDSDEALLKIVESTPGALGLVDVYSITSKVNVVKIDGKLPLEQGYLLH